MGHHGILCGDRPYRPKQRDLAAGKLHGRTRLRQRFGHRGRLVDINEAISECRRIRVALLFQGRVDYPDYDPEYICGTQSSDVSWADQYLTSATATVSNNAKNNQIDVFLDADNNNSAPTHLINDGTMSLAGSNLINSCVYSYNWIQRSVRIYVTTAGYYWLSFAADGTNNSYGGQLDEIQLCVATCPGSLQDNFPFTSNEALFEDTFESPVYSGSPYNTNGNMNNSDGASSVWDEEGYGWANAPTNQIPYWTSGCPQGNQCVELGWNANSLISRPILLDPGYYRISYDYVSEGTFATLSGVYCGATPTAANISTLVCHSSTAKTGHRASTTAALSSTTQIRSACSCRMPRWPARRTWVIRWGRPRAIPIRMEPLRPRRPCRRTASV